LASIAHQRYQSGARPPHSKEALGTVPTRHSFVCIFALGSCIISRDTPSV